MWLLFAAAGRRRRGGKLVAPVAGGASRRIQVEGGASRRIQVVVVGANLAGGRAVEALRREGFDGRVVLVGDEPDRPYERPPLSKEVLRSETDAASVFLREESWYADNDVELRLGVRATGLSPTDRTITLEDAETIRYDSCLLTTGGRVRTLDVPGHDLAGVRYLRTLHEAAELATALTHRPRVVVVGAGFIGAEVAASARTVGCEVTILEVLDVPLVRVLGPDLGEVYASIHRDHGVELRLGEGVERFEGHDHVEAVVGAGGTRYPADLVVVGVGIVPNVELAQEAGLDCDNGIVVDELCRASAPGVFAAGDVANRPDPYSGARIRVEHFQNAQNQGAAAARTIAGGSEPFAEVPWFWSDQYDVNLQMLGHPTPDAQRVVRGRIEERDFTALYLRSDRVVAAVAMNRGRDIAVARRLIERGISVDATRAGDETVELRELLKA
ncbi:MAG: NAD(P)/FAD-dependent oxidoreductase [Actinomycetota bacterium]